MDSNKSVNDTLNKLITNSAVTSNDISYIKSEVSDIKNIIAASNSNLEGRVRVLEDFRYFILGAVAIFGFMGGLLGDYVKSFFH